MDTEDDFKMTLGCEVTKNLSAILVNNSSINLTLNGCAELSSQRLIQDKLVHVRWLTVVSYLFTFLFGLFGNGLVIYVILKFKAIRIRSVANYYILNLAIADLLFILTLPFFCFATYTGKWIFGDFVCKFAFVCYECNRFASVFTLVALSIDRVLATYPHLASFRSIKVGTVVCLAIWLIGLTSCTPLWAVSGARQTSNVTKCMIFWPRDPYLIYQQVWEYLKLVLGLLLPLVLIVTSNIHLMKRIKSMPSLGSRGRSLSASRRSSCMTRTVFAIVSCFVICQIPKYASDVIRLQVLLGYSTLSRSRTYTLVHFNMLAVILVFISSCINPIVCGIFNRNYRTLYKEVLCCGDSKGNSNERNSTKKSRPARPNCRPIVHHALECSEQRGNSFLKALHVHTKNVGERRLTSPVDV